MENVKQLKQSDIKAVREEIREHQNNLCPICKCRLDDSNSVLDHKHKRKNDKNVVNGNGMVRGVLCRTCNAVEGKFLKTYKRYKGNTLETQYISFLRNLADYLEKEPYNYIHPNEKEPEKKLGKRLFNKINKMYKEKYPKRKELEYPKSGKFTKQILALIEEFQIEI